MKRIEQITDQHIKKKVGEKAVDFVKDGMLVGLGSGSTVKYAFTELGRRIRQGLQIIGISSSAETTALARANHIPLLPVDDVREIDLTIDGADEIDPNGNAIKGRHGAFLQEKLISRKSRETIWVVTESKMVEFLGRSPLPVEVIRENNKLLLDHFRENAIRAELRMDKNNTPLVTENGNHIIDLYFGRITDPFGLNERLELMTGIIESGLFLNMVDKVLVGLNNKEIQFIQFERV